MTYAGNAAEVRDFARIDALNDLNDADTFYNDVRKLTKRVTSDHAIHRWEVLSGVRYEELKSGRA